MQRRNQAPPIPMKESEKMAKEKKMSNKKLARILGDALRDGDTDAIWFVIGELEKAAN
jgi:hypothetical protein